MHEALSVMTHKLEKRKTIFPFISNDEVKRFFACAARRSRKTMMNRKFAEKWRRAENAAFCNDCGLF
jgi:hypothetical protein